MNLVQLTPGAGRMYCGNCFRDNALVAELRRQGHQVLMVPLYLPLTLDETDQSAGTPIFFNGVSVYLEQQSALFRHAPAWVHRWLAAPWLLRWAAGRAAKTRAADVGELTVSMLRGEVGHQARELEQLIAWLETQPRPDIVCLSNALLLGMARRLKSALGTKVSCMFQGEDDFLDGLPEPHRRMAWETLAARAAEVDLLLTPSRYYAGVMARRLGLPAERFQLVPNGVNLDGFTEPAATARPAETAPVLGYFARMNADKGVDRLVDAFIRVKQRGRVSGLRLRVGGGCGPSDAPLVAELKARLAAAGCAAEAEFHPNLTRVQKLEFLRGLTVFSVPARCSEAFGLYVIEALAVGVPAIVPRTSAFPELIEATGGGVLYEPGDEDALARAIEGLVGAPAEARRLGETGQAAVRARFSAGAMAARVVAACETVLAGH